MNRLSYLVEDVKELQMRMYFGDWAAIFGAGTSDDDAT